MFTQKLFKILCSAIMSCNQLINARLGLQAKTQIMLKAKMLMSFTADVSI